MAIESAPALLSRHTRVRRELARRYRHATAQERFFALAWISAFALSVAFGINLLAIQYATESISNSVTDIVLSNIPAFNVDGLFVYGTFFLIAFVALILLAHPKRIPFVFFSLALFWVIRAGFTSLTHIAPFPEHTAIEFGPAITKAFFGGDLFFSGHTGTPFLFALIFWREKALRNMFLLWSVFFAAIVLLGHLHYSIDVAAAFFISYTIYEMARALFPRPYSLFHSDAPIAST